MGISSNVSTLETASAWPWPMLLPIPQMYETSPQPEIDGGVPALGCCLYVLPDGILDRSDLKMDYTCEHGVRAPERLSHVRNLLVFAFVCKYSSREYHLRSAYSKYLAKFERVDRRPCVYSHSKAKTRLPKVYARKIYFLSIAKVVKTWSSND